MVDSAYGIFNLLTLFTVFMDFNVLNCVRVRTCVFMCMHEYICTYMHMHLSVQS